MAFKFSGEKQLYVELAERYENYILQGVIKCGDKLPTVREASRDFGVNPQTVVKAYNLLEDKKMIRPIPRRGIYVIWGEEEMIQDEKENGVVHDELFKRIVTKRTILDLKDKGVKAEDVLRTVKEVYKL